MNTPKPEKKNELDAFELAPSDVPASAKGQKPKHTAPSPEHARAVPTGFELACPKDGSPMQKVKAGSTTLDRCVGCGAVWFDAKELEALQQDKKTAATIDVGGKIRVEGKIKTKDLDCPRDGTRMKEREYPDQSHILVMECPMCGGRLLDSGEFKDVTDFTLSERLKSFFS
jgi:Zn-finger nucleic acid-binding protein